MFKNIKNDFSPFFKRSQISESVREAYNISDSINNILNWNNAFEDKLIILDEKKEKLRKDINIDKDYCDAYDWEIRNILPELKEYFNNLYNVFNLLQQWEEIWNIKEQRIELKSIDWFVDFKELYCIEGELWSIMNKVNLKNISEYDFNFLNTTFSIINKAIDYMETHSYYETLEKYYGISLLYEKKDRLSSVYKKVLIGVMEDKENIIVERYNWKRESVLSAFEKQLNWEKDFLQVLKDTFIDINTTISCSYGYSSPLSLDLYNLSSIMLSISKEYDDISYLNFNKAIECLFDIIDLLSQKWSISKRDIYDNIIKTRKIKKELKIILSKQIAKSEIFWNKDVIDKYKNNIQTIEEQIQWENDEDEKQKLKLSLFQLNEQLFNVEKDIMKYLQEANFWETEVKNILGSLDVLYLLDKNFIKEEKKFLKNNILVNKKLIDRNTNKIIKLEQELKEEDYSDNSSIIPDEEIINIIKKDINYFETNIALYIIGSWLLYNDCKDLLEELDVTYILDKPELFKGEKEKYKKFLKWRNN